MPQLFSNKIKIPPKSKAENPKIQSFPKETVNLDRYKDPEGLTVTRMKIGLWFVQNKQYMIYFVYGLLIFVAMITWPRFFYVFGEYIIKGMNDDVKILKDLSTNDRTVHDLIAMQNARNILVDTPQSFKSGENFDLVAKINNPNPGHWGEFSYNFKVGSQDLGLNHGFILPGETKYVMALNKDIDSPDSVVMVSLENVVWHKINKHDYPDWEKFKKEHLDITISDKKFSSAQSSILSEKVNLNQLDFKISNNTAYGYYNTGIEIILFSGQHMVGANYYILDKLKSGEQRNINVTWPGNINQVTETTVIPEINIMDEDLYLKSPGI